MVWIPLVTCCSCYRSCPNWAEILLRNNWLHCSPGPKAYPSIANSNNFNRFELLMGALFFIPHGGLWSAYGEVKQKTLQTTKNGLQRYFLASLGRFELPAFRLGGERSILLSYRDLFIIIPIFNKKSTIKFGFFRNVLKYKRKLQWSLPSLYYCSSAKISFISCAAFLQASSIVLSPFHAAFRSSPI